MSDILRVDCPKCGKYFFATLEVRMDDDALFGTPSDRRKVSALLFERRTLNPKALPPAFVLDIGAARRAFGNESGRPYAIPIRVPDLLATWPTSVTEQLDRAICLLARIAPRAGSEIEPDPNTSFLYPFQCMAEVGEEAKYLQKHLLALEWLEHPTAVAGAKRLRLTPKGWARVAELTRTRSALRNPAFVARWFGRAKADDKAATDRTEEMRQLVDNYISPAIHASGYAATKADTDDYNTGIMDKVLYDIRRAPFVVADFTTHNLGVYYEAGFAVGQEIPVIPCCPRADFREKHFDVAHVNFIVYDSFEELRGRLERRILGSIGEGPFRHEHGETQAR
jgi:hypothetical protein